MYVFSYVHMFIICVCILISVCMFTVNLKNTVVMHRSASGKAFAKPNIFVCNKRIGVFGDFILVAHHRAQVTRRMQRDSDPFRNLGRNR